VNKSSQLQKPEDQQTKPEIHQRSEVKFVGVMPGGFRQPGKEGEIQAVAKQNGDQILEKFGGGDLHPGSPAQAPFGRLLHRAAAADLIAAIMGTPEKR